MSFLWQIPIEKANPNLLHASAEISTRSNFVSELNLTAAGRRLSWMDKIYGRHSSNQSRRSRQRGAAADEKIHRQGPAQKRNRPHQPAAQADRRANHQTADAAARRADRRAQRHTVAVGCRAGLQANDRATLRRRARFTIASRAGLAAPRARRRADRRHV